MNKLSIWVIAVAGAFVIGVLSANPVVEAVGGWQGAFVGLDTRLTALENPPPIQREIVYSQIMIVDPIITGQVGNLMHTIPDNAVITNMECPIFDEDATGLAGCTLYKKDSQGTRTTVQAISTTVAFNGGDITLSANPNETVDRETFDYYFEFTSSSCLACVAKSAKLTYTE